MVRNAGYAAWDTTIHSPINEPYNQFATPPSVVARLIPMIAHADVLETPLTWHWLASRRWFAAVVGDFGACAGFL
jgi:hypothetical protein